METNQYGECILNENDIILGFYSGKLKSLSNVNVKDQNLINQFNSSIELNADSIEKLLAYMEPSCSINEFDKNNQNTWFIPEEYKDFDIVSWLLDQCTTEQERNRTIEELELFIQHNMIDVLICLKYLVDFMRKHNIVWGLGRGSSVASYSLFLIGVHKVNSIQYELDIREFLKENKNDKENL